MPRRDIVLFAAALSLAVPPVGLAQKPPLGPPVQANTFSAGEQGGRMDCLYYERRQHDVASDAAGNFVVVWSGEYEGGSGSYFGGVFGQRFDRFGFEKGGEFRISTEQEYYANRTPTVGMADDGGFVVVWTNYKYGDEASSEIKGRRFDAAAHALGAEFRVSDNAETIQYPGYSYTLFQYYGLRNPDVAMNGDGRFVVVWHREGEEENALGNPDPLGDADGRQIAGRLFSASATPQGPGFKVSDGSDSGGDYYWNEMPDASFDDDGFVVTWKSIDSYAGGEAILGRRFDENAGPVGGELRVSSDGGYNIFETTPTIAKTDAGGFLVAWASSSIEPPGGGLLDVAARVFDANDAPVAPEFTVNTTNADYECGPRIAQFSDASFVVSWHHHYGGTGGYEAFGQLLDASGNPSGSEFLLSDDPTMVHQATAVAPQGDDFVVAWSARPDAGDYFDVFVRRFGDTEAPSCSPAPLSGCRQPTRSKAGVIRLKQNAERPSQSSLTWSWVKGEETLEGDLGDPITDTSYSLCLYDSSASSQPRATMVAPGGTKCGLFPCWFDLPGPGLMYVDNAGEIDGLTQIRLTPGADGKAKISVKGRGANLPAPAIPLAAPVMVQLQATNGECWAATYDQFISKNSDGKFIAKPTVP
jgi:hypothetical protein